MSEELIITDDLLLEELKKRINNYKQALTELHELTVQLKEVNKKLAESESLKSHFISNITNEIVNPFSSILGLAKNIITVEEGNSSQIKKMAELIHSEAFNLDFQLKNIFAAAEIEAGEILPQISKVDITQVINGQIEYFQPEICKKKIKILFNNRLPKTETEIFYFKTDAEKITLIISNLLSNAIKYSYESGVIEILLYIENNNLYFCITDNGIGISPQNQKIIFDRFTRIDNGINSLNRGHGLGLSINKAFIELLDGTIEVESQENQGSLFRIVIPESNIEIDDVATDSNEIFFGEDEIF